MRTITATQLRQRLGEILDAASAGEKILIERDHRPLAYLVSIEEARTLATEDAEVERELAALDALIAIGEEWRRTHPPAPGDLTAEATIRWDRDHRDDEKWERSFRPASDGSGPVESMPDDDPDVES